MRLEKGGAVTVIKDGQLCEYVATEVTEGADGIITATFEESGQELPQASR